MIRPLVVDACTPRDIAAWIIIGALAVMVLVLAVLAWRDV